MKKCIIVKYMWYAMFGKYRVACEIIFLAAVFSINLFFWMLRTTSQSKLALSMVVEIRKAAVNLSFPFLAVF